MLKTGYAKNRVFSGNIARIANVFQYYSLSQRDTLSYLRKREKKLNLTFTSLLVIYIVAFLPARDNSPSNIGDDSEREREGTYQRHNSMFVQF